MISVEVGAGKGCGVSFAQNVSDIFKKDSCLCVEASLYQISCITGVFIYHTGWQLGKQLRIFLTK